MSYVFAVVAAAEAEPSKLAFYLCGGLLVAWAIGLGLIGISRPTFPASRGQYRATVAVSVALAAATMAASVLTS